MIKLGITGGILPPDANRAMFSQKELAYIERDFANYWASFGVMPILIPNLKEENLMEFLPQLDGLLLMGGADITPQRYGESVLGNWEGDIFRDAYEWRILDWFVQNNYPVFGICRGFQFLNVYFGGTLYQDLPTQYPYQVKHQDLVLYDSNFHEIYPVVGELLDDLQICKNSNLVNSLHHQGVKDLGQNLTILAYSQDDLVEAFYYNLVPKGKIMGVQWHPEFFYKEKGLLSDSDSIIKHFLSFFE